MANGMTYSQSRDYSDFIDNMRNPNTEELYPFHTNMISEMCKENNLFFNMTPNYKYGEESICAYLAYKAITDSEFTLCVMADTPEKYIWITNKIYFFIKKSRYSLITKLLAWSRVRHIYYIGSARYVYIADYERTFDLDDNCFVGWVHPKKESGLIDDRRPFVYGVHAIENRMHDMRNHTIISGKDQYDVLKTKVGKYVLYYDTIEND